MKAARLLSVVGLLVLASPGLAAGDQPDLVLTVEMQEEVSVTDDQGEIQVVRKKVDNAAPGNVLIYTLTYTNTGDAPALDARVDDAVPQGTVLLPGSVRGEKAGVTFSVDGGRTYTPFPVEIEFQGPDGRTVKKKAPADEYTHIRWTAQAPLRPGESRTASFKVLVR
jgi:uncharacterized repeat protein (TIGR01451 family)